MKLRQTIRRVLKEERGLSVPVRRRIGVEELENLFNEAINVAITRFNNRHSVAFERNLFRTNEVEMFNIFQNIVINHIYYNLLFYIDSETLDIIQPYIFDDLKDYYKDRIKEIWGNIK